MLYRLFGQPLTARSILVGSLVLALVCSWVLAAGAQEKQYDRVIEVGVVPGQMKYDVEEFSVAPGASVKLIFDNTRGTLQHNLLILVPGDRDTAMELAREAWSMPNPIQKDYVPESEEVLYHTALLSPGEKETITFQAPESPGDHPYVCTMPGHAPSMMGMMHVQSPGAGTGETSSTDNTPGQIALSNLTYRYYEGKWDQLPPFDELDPVDSGTLPENNVSLEPAQRRLHFALLFEGKLKLPRGGLYKFSLASDGARLFVNGEEVVTTLGQLSVLLRTGTARLSAGVHDVRLEYFQGGGGKGLQLALSSPDGSSVELSNVTRAIDRGQEFIISSPSRPRVFRVLLPDAPPRSVAVGLPAGTHYCFDPTGGFVRYAWSGKFLNVAPERGNGDGRGGRVCDLLGDRFAVGMSTHGQPLRLGRPDQRPDYAFQAYVRGDGPPTIRYRLDDLRVVQQVRPIKGKRGIRIRYRLNRVPSQDLFYRIDRSAVDVSVSKGEWIDDSTVALPDSKRFRVTIRNPE